ncbi:MAG: hypothetical protein J2O48_01065 [Solirubrobacterales bacterium]|nr:hypothetical protein [Solirubrobacterales bacterium]
MRFRRRANGTSSNGTEASNGSRAGENQQPTGAGQLQQNPEHLLTLTRQLSNTRADDATVARVLASEIQRVGFRNEVYNAARRVLEDGHEDRSLRVLDAAMDKR